MLFEVAGGCLFVNIQLLFFMATRVLLCVCKGVLGAC